MSIELSWYLKGRILYAKVNGAITDEDDASYDARISEYLKEAKDSSVHIVTDFSGLEMLQSDIAPCDTNSDGATLRTHPALGCIVAFGGSKNPLLGYLMPFHSYALKPHHERFDTLQNALLHLCNYDATLPRNLLLTQPHLQQPA